MAERIKGKWLVRGDCCTTWLKCSVCRNPSPQDEDQNSIATNFCPKCGADMREKKENNKMELMQAIMIIKDEKRRAEYIRTNLDKVEHGDNVADRIRVAIQGLELMEKHLEKAEQRLRDYRNSLDFSKL